MIKRLNKKAVAQAIGDIIFALLVVVIGILLLSLLAKANDTKKKDLGAAFINDAIAENNVALYLKYPVLVEGKEFTMAEFMVIIAETNNADYERIWKGLSYNYFSRLGYNMELLRVQIEKPDCSFNCAIFGGKLSGEILVGATPHLDRKIKIDSKIYLPSHTEPLLLNIQYAPR